MGRRRGEMWLRDSCVLLLFFFSSRRRHTRCLSDWSSDVCSSDLSGGTTTPPAPFIGEPVQGAGGVVVPPEGYWRAIAQIGRASCRERVEISGGGGSVKKKNKRQEEAGGIRKT